MHFIDADLSVRRDYTARGATRTYGTLHRELGSPFKRGGNVPGQIGQLCGDINTRHDATTGLPFMISTLVYNGDTHMPGPEFFESADRLELLPLDDDVLVKHAFMTTQINAVFTRDPLAPGCRARLRPRVSRSRAAHSMSPPSTASTSGKSPYL